MRYISKICLNAMYGKWGARNNLTKTLITSDPLEIEKIMSGDKFIVHSLELVSDESVMMTYSSKAEFVETRDFSNVIISLFTSSAARIKLYLAMEKIITSSPLCTLIYTDTVSFFLIFL